MFDDFFEVYLADNDEAKQIHYNIRYQVYCEEMGFEESTSSGKVEIDEWDENSVHFIVKNKRTGDFVAAMRLILPNLGYLPIETHCRLHHEVIHTDFQKVVEISRLCVVKQVRRRSYDGEPPAGLTEDAGNAEVEFFRNQRQLNRSIIWGMFRAASLYCEENRIRDWYFLTTKFLGKLIAKTNCKMEQIGDSCELNGERFPYRIQLDDILKNPIWEDGYQAYFKYYSDNDIADLKKCA